MIGVESLLAQAVDDGVRVPLLAAGIISIALGVLIFILPRLLNYIVAGYLVVVGALWLIEAL